MFTRVMFKSLMDYTVLGDLLKFKGTRSIIIMQKIDGLKKRKIDIL